MQQSATTHAAIKASGEVGPVIIMPRTMMGNAAKAP
jgi:hypothetical protein